VKERPILMSAPMVRAILAGTKTQTRSALKVQPLEILPMKGDKAGIEWVGLMERDPPKGAVFKCRHGVAGDRLWSRESWAPDEYAGQTTFYRADDEDLMPAGGWKPSIHMPRWASRITLEITGVRVERLQDISEADAQAEGVQCDTDGWFDYLMPQSQSCVNARDSYATLWDRINGPGSWDANPFVWVVEFRRVTPVGDDLIGGKWRWKA